MVTRLMFIVQLSFKSQSPPTSVNLDKTFFHSHEQKKGWKRWKKVKKLKAKKFRVSSKKVQILKLYSIGRVPPARSYCTRLFISEMRDVLRRHFSHICSLVMSGVTWVLTHWSEKVEKYKSFVLVCWCGENVPVNRWHGSHCHIAVCHGAHWGKESTSNWW